MYKCIIVDDDPDAIADLERYISELGINAYLLKPYSLERFMETSVASPEKDKSDFLFIKSKTDNLRLMKIRIYDIVAVESKLNYIQIHTLNTRIMTYMSLSEFSKILMKFEGFRQIQRSFIIAEDYIEYVEGNTIKMINGIRVSVGESYRKNFHEFVETKLVKAKRKSQKDR